jgi:hypothetical protein
MTSTPSPRPAGTGGTRRRGITLPTVRAPWWRRRHGPAARARVAASCTPRPLPTGSMPWRDSRRRSTRETFPRWRPLPWRAPTPPHSRPSWVETQATGMKMSGAQHASQLGLLLLPGGLEGQPAMQGRQRGGLGSGPSISISIAHPHHTSLAYLSHPPVDALPRGTVDAAGTIPGTTIMPPHRHAAILESLVLLAATTAPPEVPRATRRRPTRGRCTRSAAGPSTRSMERGRSGRGGRRSMVGDARSMVTRSAPCTASTTGTGSGAWGGSCCEWLAVICVSPSIGWGEDTAEISAVSRQVPWWRGGDVGSLLVTPVPPTTHSPTHAHHYHHTSPTAGMTQIMMAAPPPSSPGTGRGEASHVTIVMGMAAAGSMERTRDLGGGCRGLLLQVGGQPVLQQIQHSCTFSQHYYGVSRTAPDFFARC